MPTSKLSQPALVLSLAEVLRRPVLVVACAVFVTCMVFGKSTWVSGGFQHETIEWFGIVLIFTCVFGRTWCALYIGGKKQSGIIAIGPYSICRNPLYVFSMMGAAGLGAQLGSISMAVATGVFVWAVFYVVVLNEEKALLTIHGAAYRDYCARVPRYLPRPSLWSGPDMLEIQVAKVTRTFLDACVFLLAIPLAEIFEQLQDMGWIPVLFRLP